MARKCSSSSSAPANCRHANSHMPPGGKAESVCPKKREKEKTKKIKQEPQLFKAISCLHRVCGTLICPAAVLVAPLTCINNNGMGGAHVFSLGQCGVCAMFGFNCSPIYLPTPLRTRFPVSRVQITLSHTLIIKWNYMFRKLKLDELKYVPLKLQLKMKKMERKDRKSVV